MVDWDDFHFELESQREPDQYQLSAREEQADFFETKKMASSLATNWQLGMRINSFIGLRLEP